MDGHNVTGLSDPTNDDMVASKGYVDGNFLDLAGGAMVGDIDMGGYEIKNMLRTPTTDLSAVTKKWVSDEFHTYIHTYIFISSYRYIYMNFH